MSHLRIPTHWTIQRSTPFFTKETVPAALLSHHNTAEGVFGQLCVMEGTVTYYALPMKKQKILKQKLSSMLASLPQVHRSIGTESSYQTTRNLISISGQKKIKPISLCFTQKNNPC